MRGEQPFEVTVVVAAGEADVVDADIRGERMRGLVEAPLGPVEAEPVEHEERELLLAVGGKRPVQRRDVDRLPLRHVRDDGLELGLEHVEDARDLLCLHERLEVVEQRVVGIVVGLEAVRVLEPELDIPLQMGAQQLEVGGRARLLPGVVAA